MIRGAAAWFLLGNLNMAAVWTVSRWQHRHATAYWRRR